MSTTIPKNAKKPADHQAQKNEAQPHMAGDITFEYDGNEYTVAAAAGDDVELLELLEDDKTVTVVRQVLGKEQWDQWKDRYRGDNGRVSTDAVEPFLTALFDALKAGNSSASPVS